MNNESKRWKRKNTWMKNKRNSLEDKESGNEEREITERRKKKKKNENAMYNETKTKEEKEYPDEK